VETWVITHLSDEYTVPPERIQKDDKLKKWGYPEERLPYLAGQFNKAVRTRPQWNNAYVTPPELIDGGKDKTINELIDFLCGKVGESSRGDLEAFATADVHERSLEAFATVKVHEQVKLWLVHDYFHRRDIADTEEVKQLLHSIEDVTHLAGSFNREAANRSEWNHAHVLPQDITLNTWHKGTKFPVLVAFLEWAICKASKRPEEVA